jgi:endonuclease YncB( thermonuclease family)
VLGGLVALVLGPSILDAANGAMKPHEGCRILAVVDGDTVRMLCPEAGLVAGRLLGFDTPELSPPRCPSELAKGLAATFVLRWTLWTAHQIVALPRGTDRYGRTLTQVSVDGRNVAGALIGRGLARAYDGGPRASWCA